MSKQTDDENVAQLLELLGIHQRTRRELERREAKFDSLSVPLELRGDMVSLREQIDNVEARLQTATDGDLSEKTAQTLHRFWLTQAQAEQSQVQALQQIRQRKMAELKKRIASYGPGEAPLNLLNSLANEQESLAALDERLRRVEADLADLTLTPEAPPTRLQLTIVTVDGARYETEVDSDLLVAQLQRAFLENWQPPARQESVRYILQVESTARSLEPALTLAQAGIDSGTRLQLVEEALSPSSAVGLVIEDPEGSRYTTAVRLDTSVHQLAQAFLESLGRSGQATVALLAGTVDTEPYRSLRNEATLYEERIGEGARLRIAPVA